MPPFFYHHQLTILPHGLPAFCFSPVFSIRSPSFFLNPHITSITESDADVPTLSSMMAPGPFLLSSAQPMLHPALPVIIGHPVAQARPLPALTPLAELQLYLVAHPEKLALVKSWRSSI